MITKLEFINENIDIKADILYLNNCKLNNCDANKIIANDSEFTYINTKYLFSIGNYIKPTTYLIELSLISCDIYGVYEFSSDKLESLNLDNNEITKLKLNTYNLKKLSARNNLIKKFSDLNLPKLKSIDLSKNKLEETILINFYKDIKINKKPNIYIYKNKTNYIIKSKLYK